MGGIDRIMEGKLEEMNLFRERNSKRENGEILRCILHIH
jgi:hypothetical protein